MTKMTKTLMMAGLMALGLVTVAGAQGAKDVKVTNTALMNNHADQAQAHDLVYDLAMQEVQEAANRDLVTAFWNQLFNQHDASVVDTMVGDTYIQHNPGFKDGKANFKTAITGFLQEFPNSSAEIKHIGASGDLVYIHNHVKVSPEDRGQAAMDIFRVQNGKIVEHWDILQDIPETSENTNTMF